MLFTDNTAVNIFGGKTWYVHDRSLRMKFCVWNWLGQGSRVFVKAPGTRPPAERPPRLVPPPAAHEKGRFQPLCQYRGLPLKSKKSFASFIVDSAVLSFSCELTVCVGLSPDLRQHLGGAGSSSSCDAGCADQRAGLPAGSQFRSGFVSFVPGPRSGSALPRAF